ncbi:MarR family transcriptional regulator [Dactylosporangium sp. NPDC005572]|uniref:helix-turn-helix domain-containing protein n=1 Tax=Dactylosporangium sp. NPDC005572 TaxID=3156889 RepID=UPI00339DED4E
MLVDIAQHPDSSISEITGRTGFPQSHVSASIARLIESGDVVSDADPGDRRRTRVKVNPKAAGALLVITDTPVDDAIADALPDTSALPEVLAALDTLSRHLNPSHQQR